LHRGSRDEDVRQLEPIHLSFGTAPAVRCTIRRRFNRDRRFIAREDLIKADALPAATTIATERGPRAGVEMPPSMFAATDEVIEGVEPLPELAQRD